MAGPIEGLRLARFADDGRFPLPREWKNPA